MGTTSNDCDSFEKNPGNKESDVKDEQSNINECNICLDNAEDPVVHVCGHLFCWPCLHKWLETGSSRLKCPACKAFISKDKVIPIYGRGRTNQDPRNEVPPRPAGQITEPVVDTGFYYRDGGFHLLFEHVTFSGLRQDSEGQLHHSPPYFVLISLMTFIWLQLV